MYRHQGKQLEHRFRLVGMFHPMTYPPRHRTSDDPVQRVVPDQGGRYDPADRLRMPDYEIHILLKGESLHLFIRHSDAPVQPPDQDQRQRIGHPHGYRPPHPPPEQPERAQRNSDARIQQHPGGF
ncbi:hypothetical protein [Bacteroides fragilis]|uniref:hypothetical protein n=1 Tax=Bacteroides fragilis TaxID=817 RepID=UPI00202E3636|nr:hypothetical protein [Bacteroides fragilis]MCM0276833.1 hypothetical protein [Bacteroides fragilis]MCM0315943.1 hypothetical protein [Bacteroides fragilis]